MSRKDVILARLDDVNCRIKSLKESIARQEEFINGLSDLNDKQKAQELLFISARLLRFMRDSRDRLFRDLDRM